MAERLEFIAPASRGTEGVLAEELRQLGAADVRELRGAVGFAGALSVGYRALLWSRTASRVLLTLARFQAVGERALYEAVRAIRWTEHLGPDATLAVDCVGRADWLSNSHFAELRVKDAVVDRLRDETGARPGVDVRSPDIRLHLYLGEREAVLSLDLAGEALHRRGISRATGDAPLKENLAAAILLLAGWPEAAARGEPLLDPMCGAGTLLIEAGWMARDVAPGIHRDRWGFLAWRGHEPARWRALVDEARARRAEARERPLRLYGYDTTGPSLAAAADNGARAGLGDALSLERRPLGLAEPPPGPPGMLVTNPPYGVRLGEERELGPLYAELGDVLRHRFLGWSAWVLTGSRALAGRIGLRPARRLPLWNGPIECRLLALPIAAEAPRDVYGPSWRERGRGERFPAALGESEGSDLP